MAADTWLNLNISRLWETLTTVGKDDDSGNLHIEVKHTIVVILK